VHGLDVQVFGAGCKFVAFDLIFSATLSVVFSARLVHSICGMSLYRP